MVTMTVTMALMNKTAVSFSLLVHYHIPLNETVLHVMLEKYRKKLTNKLLYL